jgi:hypothetical protein
MDTSAHAGEGEVAGDKSVWESARDRPGIAEVIRDWQQHRDDANGRQGDGQNSCAPANHVNFLIRPQR